VRAALQAANSIALKEKNPKSAFRNGFGRGAAHNPTADHNHFKMRPHAGSLKRGGADVDKWAFLLANIRITYHCPFFAG